jgi:long-chain acyl-CoA synthetase
LAQNPKLKEAVLKELNNQATVGKLKGFERIKNIVIEPENFQVKDLVTNTFKLKRVEAKEAYKMQLDQMYAEINAPKN